MDTHTHTERDKTALLPHTGIWCSYLRVEPGDDTEGRWQDREEGLRMKGGGGGGKGAVSWFCMATLKSH